VCTEQFDYYFRKQEVMLQTGGWTKLHNLKKDEMGWACSTKGEKKNSYRILVGKPEGKRPLGRPRRRWVDNIKMDLREIGSDGADLMDMAQDRDQWRALVNTVLNLRVP
jgi:hypothetical protein